MKQELVQISIQYIYLKRCKSFQIFLFTIKRNEKKMKISTVISGLRIQCEGNNREIVEELTDFLEFLSNNPLVLKKIRDCNLLIAKELHIHRDEFEKLKRD